jgi:hypothetical protein
MLLLFAVRYIVEPLLPQHVPTGSDTAIIRPAISALTNQSGPHGVSSWLNWTITDTESPSSTDRWQRRFESAQFPVPTSHVPFLTNPCVSKLPSFGFGRYF